MKFELKFPGVVFAATIIGLAVGMSPQVSSFAQSPNPTAIMQSVAVQSPTQQATSRDAKTVDTTGDENSISDDRKQVLRAFVNEHQPNVARLLGALQRRAPVQYQKAIASLDRDVRRLEVLQKRDPEGYELGLNKWKNRSSIDLLLANIALRGESLSEADRQTQMDRLKRLVDRREDLRIAQARLDFQRAKSRSDRLQSQMTALVSAKTENVNQGVSDLLNRAAKMRRGMGDSPDGKPGSPRDRSSGEDEKSPDKSGN